MVAANFAFDIANRKNLYNEYEDEVPDDIWGDDDWEDEEENEEENINDIEVESEVVEPEDDFIVVDEEEPQPVKVIQKGPNSHRVLYSDGTEKKIDKNSDIIRYL